MASELRLKFSDANGETKEVLVEGENFFVGRHSENDLVVTESGVSRRHLEIDRFDNVFIVSDNETTYGTRLNGADLTDPVELKDGDVLTLGGNFEIRVEITSDEDSDDFSAADVAEAESVEQAEIASQVTGGDLSAATKNTSSVTIGFFVLAPLLGICFLGLFGSLFYVLTGKDDKPVNRRPEIVYDDTPRRTPEAEDDPKDDKSPTPTVKPSAKPSEATNAAPTATVPDELPPVTDDADKIERNALAFTRRIALNDDNYVFSRAQIAEIAAQIKSFSGSAALRDNLQSVKQNAAQFEQLAQTKGLKPQFLATAALAAGSGGNPLQTAKEMLNVLGELKISLGNELTDENLLIIAAYDQGTRGDFRQMRNTVEVLSKQPGADARRVRTVWYLREKGKLTDAQYRLALRFLAIGAISQKPSDFNVKAEPTVFN